MISTKSRILYLFYPIIIFLCFSFLIVPWDRAFAQSREEHLAKLIEGAKKEGNLRLCSGMSIEEVNQLLRGFNKKYPFIKTTVWRGGSEEKLQRIILEARAGVHNYDVYNNSMAVFEVLHKHGLFGKYFSPENKFFEKMDADPEGYWTNFYSSYFVVGYNKKLISPSDVPKSYMDLLDPKYKGKMGMDTKAFLWFYGLLREMGEKEGLAYFQRLARQNILFRTGKTLMTNLVVAGEVAMGITLYRERVEELKHKGAPIDWVALEPVITEMHPMSLSAYAQNPNAAKLYFDFILKEGSDMIDENFRTPARIGINYKGRPLRKGVKILPYPWGFVDEQNRIAKLYREILMKK